MENTEIPKQINMNREQVLTELKSLVQEKCSSIDAILDAYIHSLTEEDKQIYFERKEKYRSLLRYVRENLN
jgi:hypothetical protein